MHRAFVCVSWFCMALSERTREGEAGCQQIVKMPSVQSPAADSAIYMNFAFTPPLFTEREREIYIKRHILSDVLGPMHTNE